MFNNKKINLLKLLEKQLKIPNYQRSYEWDKSNVYILIEDIIKNYKKNVEVNLGTIILYQKDDKYEIVDGQQRIITLSLLLKSFESNLNIKILDEKILCVFNTEKRIINNYNSIKTFIGNLEEQGEINKDKFYKYLISNISFYLLVTTSQDEAFQLFDGRNSKYKDLSPVDLLKAYHLGELPIKISKEEKIRILKVWNRNMTESFKIDESISKNEYLYKHVLFNIYNWSINKDIRPFTKDDIYLYKGFKSFQTYEYVKYYKSNTSKKYLINKPFSAGKDFFDMTAKFIEDYDKIIKECNLKLLTNVSDDNYRYHFKYINYLYYNSLFVFYNKFGYGISNFHNEVIKDYIFKWSVTHRVKNKMVNIQTINNYVLKGNNNFFFECNNALSPGELFKLEIEECGNRPRKNEKLGDMRSNLWKKLN